MSVPSYLLLSRHAVYYFRIVVPEAIRPLFGRREIRRSLQTRNKREALIRSRELLVGVQRLFTTAYQGNRPKLGALKGAWENGDQRGEGWVKWLGQQQWLHNEPQKPDTAYQALNPTGAPQGVPKLAPALSQVMAMFRESQEREGVSTKTLDDKQAVGNLLIRIVGDLPIDQYTKQDSKTFRETALKLPPLLYRLPQGKSIKRIIEEATKTISITTYNNYIKNLVSIFAYSVREDYREDNPFFMMKVRRKRKPNTYRSVFTHQELEKIFKTISVLHGSNKTSRYWLPYLGLYTGARLNELCQLYIDDIKTVNGIPCIHIQGAKPDQRLKTLHTERVIPLHSRLLSLGFIEYVEELACQGHKRVFPELVLHKKHGYSASPSKWFGRLREQLGLKEGVEQKDFHSFRHSIADHLKQKGVSEALIGGILGHTTGGITNNRYGKDFKPLSLQPVIEQIGL